MGLREPALRLLRARVAAPRPGEPPHGPAVPGRRRVTLPAFRPPGRRLGSRRDRPWCGQGEAKEG
ncbi:hypothetical protein PR202_gb05323 [Eleusine coracana subsp. coracana]|uniref:Uncharacterized protein n=1 Tax=Eleusine coracana subsp. coracana TaxID=191504 RepID=A0AAV5E6W9_ELECO|nr:hypothetical protein PR202_gb05323 [Eleusine coracana subsp. coracana]